MGRRATTKKGRVTAKRPPDAAQRDFGFEQRSAPNRISVTVPDRPIWTENKAKLIERYLYYFVLVTKHGTYIDGFAGPQYPRKLDAWAARLVLESEPRWLRHFHLCEINQRKFVALGKLRDQQPSPQKGEPKRSIKLYNRDFNRAVADILPSISEREATFCLIDQHTFECQWTTVEQLARHKRGQKIELFYFLAAWWFGRAFRSIRDRAQLRRWWGRDDFEKIGNLSSWERAELVCERMRNELRYRHAVPWAIYSKAQGGHIAYHMIHASDHDDAPGLMSRAYRKAVDRKEPPEQFMLEFGGSR